MRYSAMLGSLLAMALGGIGLGSASYGMSESTLRLRAFGPDVLYDGRPERHSGTRTQRHTGAGGAGMHRAWKKRRASGRRL